jgi:plasmid stabilization system protein ParE
MNYRVIIEDEALNRATEFINYMLQREQSPVPAAKWWAKALAAIESLANMPNRFPRAPEGAHTALPLRMLRVDSCLFLYRVDEDERSVRIVGFRHGSQDVV